MFRVEAHNLGKCYKRYARPRHRIGEWLSAGRLRRHESHWVVQGVSFQLAPGEALGIVGRNGAGKTTLLRMIHGTVIPSAGEVRVAGRVAALELGLRFHPDFTGRENVLATASLLGLRRAQVLEAMPAIEEFAEIGAAFDEPVRTYSSGMVLRLAFSLSTAVPPDLLIVDEALAVGDAYFQHKCVARIREYLQKGMSLLFVSHDPFAVRTLCQRAILLERGLLIREGPPDTVLEYYNAIIAKLEADYEIRQAERLRGGGEPTTRSGNGAATVEEVELLGPEGPTRSIRVGEPLRIRVRGRAHQRIEDLTVGIAIRDRLGNDVYGTNTRLLRPELRPRLEPGETVVAQFELPAHLGPGDYSVTAALHAGVVHTEGNYDWQDRVALLRVIPGDHAPFVGSCFLPVELDFRWGDGAAPDSLEPSPGRVEAPQPAAQP